MPIPDYQSIMRPLLALLEDGQVHKPAALHQALCDYFQLTPEEIQQSLKSGQAVMRNRLGWARTYLHKAGLVKLPARGQWQITDQGCQALVDCPETINNQYLKQYPGFLDFVTPNKGTSEPSSVLEGEITENTATPEEALESAHQSLQQTLANELLLNIKQASPAFFEQLVVDLMLAMGYGGSREDAGKATQLSADGGIDGIINEDRLGLDTIYLQAKRWEGTVGRPEIQKFAGALQGVRAKKGVFITTSDYSEGAKEFAANLDSKIVLINGELLTDLMIEYDLGVSPKQTYTVTTLDTDYFVE